MRHAAGFPDRITFQKNTCDIFCVYLSFFDSINTHGGILGAVFIRICQLLLRKLACASSSIHAQRLVRRSIFVVVELFWKPIFWDMVQRLLTSKELFHVGSVERGGGGKTSRHVNSIQGRN